MNTGLGNNYRHLAVDSSQSVGQSVSENSEQPSIIKDLSEMDFVVILFMWVFRIWSNVEGFKISDQNLVILRLFVVSLRHCRKKI